MKPQNRPQATRAEIEEIAATAFGGLLPTVYVVGIRGYYKRTMGDPTKNDRGIYDDALFIVAPHVFLPFNANTDPSRFRHGIATLVPGVHWYKPGNHGISKPGGGYPAFRPATPGERLPVTRDGKHGMSDGIAINIHRGGYTATSSEGCQTIHPDQWPEFQRRLMLALAAANCQKFPYILTEL